MTDQTGVPVYGSGTGEPDYSRPPGVSSSFAGRDPSEPPLYSPPPRTASPEERDAFGRPPGGGPFAPLPGERMPARHVPAEPVNPAVAAAFGPTRGASEGFDAPPGSRIDPAARAPESPWWKADAYRDPWRDAGSPYWLGQGAVFSGGRPSQRSADEDVEADDDDFQPLAEDEPQADKDESRSARRARLGIRALLLGVVIALVAGAIGGGAGYVLTHRADNLLHRPDVKLAKGGTPANRPPGSVADIAKRVGPSVVSIAVTTPDEYAVGSGVVINADGYVLTNNHVVAAARPKGSIVITFSDEATAKATIVGLDPVSDLAVLKVSTTNLTVAALGKSDLLAVGDPVVAIGSPLGLNGTVTTGIVSALNRAVHVPAQDGVGDVYLDAIQTDAAINPGNSGGALVAADGTVVGINSAAATNSSSSGGATIANGIGYAIPINYARDIAEQLIHTGSAVHGSLGAQGRTATTGVRQGAYLVQVDPNGPAAKAGLVAGDVIVVAGGKPVETYDQLAVIVQQGKPGSSLTVTYFRGAAEKTATVTLGKL